MKRFRNYLNMVINTFFISLICYGQNLTQQIKLLHYKADYKNCIELIDSNQDKINEHNILHELLLIKADCYLKLVQPEKYFTSVKEYFKLLQGQFSDRDSLLYLFHKAHYHHYRLDSDSSVILAEQSMLYYNKIKHHLLDSLKTKFLVVYGNCMRNKRHFNGKFWNLRKPLDIHEKSSILALEKALITTSESKKHIVYRVLGSNYNDMFHYFKRSDSGISKRDLNFLFQRCVNYYLKALKTREKTVKNDKLFRSQVFSLLGLTYQYNEQFDIADDYYEKAVSATFIDEEIIHTKAFFSAISWKGWNWNQKYIVTGNMDDLKMSIETYEKGAKYSLDYFQQQIHDTKGVHDGYRVSILQKLANSLFYLYQETQDKKYINQALYYADLDNYLTYRSRRKINDSITVSCLQRVIDSSETIVVLLNSMYPDKIMSIIITKQNVEFLHINDMRIKIVSKTLNKLTGKEGIKTFKSQAFALYKYIFKPIVPYIEKQENLIIIPASNFAGLNFELLISEPSKDVNEWKKLPYLFHQYNISYALSPSILRDNYVSNKKENKQISILQDSFSDKPNLLFSEKLSKELKKRYNASIYKSIRRDEVMNKINKSNVFMTIGHGNGSLYTSENTIDINDTMIITAQDFYKEQLNTSLFITTACKTNISKTNFSEGLSGGFSKAMMYSGIHSTLTTNWEIDDQSSYYILKKFFLYLEKGQKRSRALWLAKKDYWNYFESDVMFQPFYWSAFQLTGKTSPIKLTKKENSNRFYWLLIIIPFFLIYFLIRKCL